MIESGYWAKFIAQSIYHLRYIQNVYAQGLLYHEFEESKLHKLHQKNSKGEGNPKLSGGKIKMAIFLD